MLQYMCVHNQHDSFFILFIGFPLNSCVSNTITMYCHMLMGLKHRKPTTTQAHRHSAVTTTRKNKLSSQRRQSHTYSGVLDGHSAGSEVSPFFSVLPSFVYRVPSLCEAGSCRLCASTKERGRQHESSEHEGNPRSHQ